MATRTNPGSKSNQFQQPLPTGYETKPHGLPDLTIPSCGVEDVDTAIFNLFDKEIAPEVGGTESSPLKRVPIIFAAGEKWALLKKGRPLRDRNNTLLLPLITVMRTEVTQQMNEDVAGRGINQQTGEIIIKRRLDNTDRGYQNLINKINLTNQQNVSVNINDTVDLNVLRTTRDVGSLENDPDVRAGALLKPSLQNNAFETIVVPAPQFYTVKYQVTVWTQFMQHTNQILERIITSFLPQGQAWRLDTPKGYWFVATVDGGNYETETNFDDMSQAERFIKNTFSVTVPAYFFATKSPGQPIPLKRYVSAPSISFETIEDNTEAGLYVLGSDDPTLPLSEVNESSNREDQRATDYRLHNRSTQNYNDEALAAMRRGYKAPSKKLTYKDVRTSNAVTSRKAFRGETVYKDSIAGGIEIILQGK